MADTVVAGGILTPIHRTNQTSVAAPIAEVFTPTGPCEIIEVRIHLSAAGGAGTFTVSLDSGNGSVYDALLESTAMATVTDIWLTNVGIILASGDALNFDWANASERIVGIEVVWRTL